MTDFANTYREETEQLVYARRVGLMTFEQGGLWPVVDLPGATVVDLSGGPSSLLLKCRGVGHSLVVEPDPMPRWVHDRYRYAGVRVLRAPPDRVMIETPYDEAWAFCALGPSDNPRGVAEAARRAGRLLRAFEWLDRPGYEPLAQADVEEWLGLEGTTELLGSSTAWYAVGLPRPPDSVS